MKYVLDSSVALKWVLAEVDSHKAVRLRNEYIDGQHELLAPDLFAPEIANALASAERQNRIQPGQSAVFLNDILSAAPAIYPTTPLLIRSMELAIATRRAVYDCIYLALAEAEGCEFLTADDQFARGLNSAYPFVFRCRHSRKQRQPICGRS
jgi:predicted nucleic acid-binding protein